MLKVGLEARQYEDSVQEDFITVENLPNLLRQHFILKINYMCNIESIAGVQIYADSDTRQHIRIFEKSWICKPASGDNESKSRFVKLVLPDIIAYQDDWIMKRSIVISNVKIRVFLLIDSPMPSFGDTAYDNAHIKSQHSVQVLPPYSRPFKDHQICHQWYIQHLPKYKERPIKQCSYQSEVVELLGFPAAFSETNDGITRQLPAYTDVVLLHETSRKFTESSFTFSTWLFLVDYCQSSLCSIMKRKSFYDNQYLTPLLLLNGEGQIHLQVVQTNGESYSFLPALKLPLKQWFRLIYTQNSGKWDIYINYGENFEVEEHTGHVFPHGAYINDMDGMIYLGGCSSLVGFKGYMAETRFYRRHVMHPHQIYHPAKSHAMFSIGIEDFYAKCDRFQKRMNFRFHVYHMMIAAYNNQRSCSADITRFIKNDFVKSKTSQIETLKCSPWKAPILAKHAIVVSELRELAAEQVTELSEEHFNDISQKLYDAVTIYLEEGLFDMPDMITLLKQASCYGNHEASYMLSVLYNNGVGVKMSLKLGWLYLLISTLGNYKIALMASGNKHYLGLDGYPKDYDYSFNYYRNVAQQSAKDREVHNPQGIYTEHVRLTDKAALDIHKGESADYFVWLKYQAKHGVGDAQSTLGRLLFWGQQGVDRNMEAAVQYYQTSAEAADASAIALYDYGIILMRGQGVEQNISKAVEILHKSAEMGHAPALSALGWHASKFEDDQVKAVEYWEEADRLGNKDAAFNLGHLHNIGAYPGEQADPRKAFDYFQRAAVNGHMDGGLVLSQFYNQGVQDYIERNPRFAVMWAKYIAEEYGSDLGKLLKQGVDSYLDQSWAKAYVYYLMAAESGLEVAQFNIAFLCDENYDSLTTSYIEKECALHFYNLSTMAGRPHPHALIKMGDYHWYGCTGKRDVSAAVDMYVKAAQANDPHGLFNLAYLVEEDTYINTSTWQLLGMPENIYNGTDKQAILIDLYQRCRDHNNEDSFVPCSLALLRIQLIDLWNRYSLLIKVMAVAGATVISYLYITTSLTQRRQYYEMEAV
ncbi:protein sel-1 homolog 3-like isoform X2 [Ptychodera flava]|uniref:protein sel-1 homolog 3-like isoform X2 n=1 Tax=Ptychodera flava TaxID=63121 RepID=UPI00396A9243